MADMKSSAKVTAGAASTGMTKEEMRKQLEALQVEKAYSTSVTQNPMFQTTANDYGQEAPCKETRHAIHAARSNAFTKGFSGATYRNASLNTSCDAPTYEETTHVSMY